MKQLNIFSDIQDVKKRKIGRPKSITKEIVFNIKKDINNGLKNKNIIQKHKINERTFFRIKKGDYDYLFKQALENHVDEFSLDFTE